MNRHRRCARFGLTGGLAVALLMLPVGAQSQTSVGCLASAVLGDPEGTLGIGCGCHDGSGQLDGGSGDWAWASGLGGVTARALPGIVCHMNVGNIDNNQYGLKIDTCAHLEGRAAEVSGAGCDTITVVELMSGTQCAQACAPGELTGPDTEACRLCKGCPPEGDPGPTGLADSCERQASVVCPADQYDVYCAEAPASSVGCDCICQKRGPCTTRGPECQYHEIRVEDLSWTDSENVSHPCDVGNYASCTTCTDPYGGPSMGHCVVHPSHCNAFLVNPSDRTSCLEGCSSPLVQLAAATISGMDYRTMSGDFNCTPHATPCETLGGVAECPWLDAGDSYDGMEICPQSSGTAAVGAGGYGGGSSLGGTGVPNCVLDFVLSNHCGCGETAVVWNSAFGYGDHRTIIFGAAAQPTVEIVPGTSHRLLHGQYTLLVSDGNTVGPIHYSSQGFEGPLGSSCGAAAWCGSDPPRGFILSHTENCWSEHQARLRQPAGCFQEGKALLCGEASAWAVTMGASQSHGADTADSAGADASAGGGGQWSADCDRQDRVVDLRRATAIDLISDPFWMRANADANCTANPSPPLPDPGLVSPNP